MRRLCLYRVRIFALAGTSHRVHSQPRFGSCRARSVCPECAGRHAHLMFSPVFDCVSPLRLSMSWANLLSLRALNCQYIETNMLSYLRRIYNYIAWERDVRPLCVDLIRRTRVERPYPTPGTFRLQQNPGSCPTVLVARGPAAPILIWHLPGFRAPRLSLSEWLFPDICQLYGRF